MKKYSIIKITTEFDRTTEAECLGLFDTKKAAVDELENIIENTCDDDEEVIAENKLRKTGCTAYIIGNDAECTTSYINIVEIEI